MTHGVMLHHLPRDVYTKYSYVYVSHQAPSKTLSALCVAIVSHCYRSDWTQLYFWLTFVIIYLSNVSFLYDLVNARKASLLLPPGGIAAIAIRRVCWFVCWLVRSLVNIRWTTALAGRRPASGRALNVVVALQAPGGDCARPYDCFF